MVAATHWADLHRLPTPADDDAHPAFGSISTETSRLLADGVNGTEGMTWATARPSRARTEPPPRPLGPGNPASRGSCGSWERAPSWSGSSPSIGPDHGTVEDADGCSGLTRIEALVDTPDAEAFELAVADIATALHTLGDDDPLVARRAKAVGILADPQHALDVASAAQTDPAADSETGLARRRPRRRGPVAGRALVVDLHVHLTPSDLGAPSCPVGPVARDGQLGPLSRAAVKRWLTQLAPSARIRVRPVLDLADDAAIDAYEVPRDIADRVDERDLVCSSPGAAARHDPAPPTATTSSRTCLPTRADLPARPAPRAWLGCAATTTGSRRTAAGATDAVPTAP